MKAVAPITLFVMLTACASVEDQYAMQAVLEPKLARQHCYESDSRRAGSSRDKVCVRQNGRMACMNYC